MSFFSKYKIKLTFVLVSLEAIRCEPKKSDGLATETDDDTARAIGGGTAMTVSEIDNEKLAMEFFASPLIVKPMYAMTKWRHPKTRDGRLTIFSVLQTGTIDQENGVETELLNSEHLQLSFSWPSAFLNADKLMHAMVSFSDDLKDGQGPLLAQGLRDFIYPLHSEVSEEVVSTCTIPLPFPVKLDFTEDVIKFNWADTTTLYFI